jgi:hypothetical protein
VNGEVLNVRVDGIPRLNERQVPVGRTLVADHFAVRDGELAALVDCRPDVRLVMVLIEPRSNMIAERKIEGYIREKPNEGPGGENRRPTRTVVMP